MSRDVLRGAAGDVPPKFKSLDAAALREINARVGEGAELEQRAPSVRTHETHGSSRPTRYGGRRGRQRPSMTRSDWALARLLDRVRGTQKP